jgi:transcriptional regulator with XRE-family HTH domain
MAGQPRMFGTELRRMRMQVGLSLAQLSGLVHYSKGHLSKIETGVKAPSADLVRLCDAALRAEGALVTLVAEQPAETRRPEATTDDEVWSMSLASEGTRWFRPMNRRDAPVLNAMAGFGLSTQGISATAGEAGTLEIFRSLFDQLRQLGQAASPGVVLPSVIAQTHVLRRLATLAPDRTRSDLLVLGARYAEFAGWMAQESGNDQAALWWTAQAVEMAAAGGDHDLAAYALVRRALVTLYREDATQTIDLARQAQVHQRTPKRIRGLAAQREAQGHALAVDYDACMRSLDRARELLGSVADDAAGAALGPVNLPDPVAMVTGWCLHELGRPTEAGEILDAEVARIRPQALRSRARYGVRQALAHASAGQIEHACTLTAPLLSITDVVGSATIATDLRRLARVLARWHRDAAVRELYPALTEALRSQEV